MMATLMKRAPANVVPIALKTLFCLKFFIRRGMVPTMATIDTNNSINNSLRIMSRVYSSILIIKLSDLIKYS